MAWDKAVLEQLQPPPPKKLQGIKPVWPEEPDDDTRSSCSLVLVGEAPGRQEVEQNKPFVGSAGQILRGIVSDLKLRGIHYTNASYYRPTPRNGKDTRPLASQLSKERARLLTEIFMLRPKAVVALGSSADLALCPQAFKVRGRVVNVTWLGWTVPVYFTWHPSFVHYNPDAYPDIYQDIERAANLVRPQEPTTNLYVPQNGEVFDFVGENLVVDVETNGTPVHLAQLVCAVFRDDVKDYLCLPSNVLEFAGAVDRYQNRASSGSSLGGKVIGQNTPGDEAVLRRAGIAIRFTDDTLLHHHAHDSRRGSHGLKTLGPVIGGVDTKCDLIAGYIGKGSSLEGTDEPAPGWVGIPPQTLYEYCAGDAAATAAVHHALVAEDDERTTRLYGFLQRCLRNFSEGLVRGIRIDRDLLSRETERTRIALDAERAKFTFDPGSHDETLEALRVAGYNLRDTKKETLVRLGVGLPAQVLAYRKVAKLYTAFLFPLHSEWLREDDLLHPLHKLYGTSTGRTSSAEPNVQQIPAGLKDLFVARPGHTLIGWDFKAHEVRGLAYVTEDQSLLDRLRNEPNFDPHQAVADLVAVPRAAGKRGVFGRAYGAGENKLWSTGAYPTKASVSLVAEAVDKLFPGLGAWREATIKQMMEIGYLETPFGRRRYFPYINRRNRHHLENVACNFLPQSLCNDIALSTGNHVFERFGYPTLLFVHDFCLIEVEEKNAKKIAKYVKGIDPYPNEKVRFIPEVYIANTWGGMKGASSLDDSSDSDDDNLTGDAVAG